jgi:hypothetical protein
MQAEHLNQPARRARRRGRFVAFTIALAAVAAACTTAGGSFNIAIGGTINLPTITAPPAFQGVDVFGCQIGFETPGLTIRGATATIPGVNINPGAGTITIPNIQLNLPAVQVQLPSLVACGSSLNLGTISLPARVTATGVLQVATLDLTISATVTIPFSILGVSFPIVIPLNPITVHV